MSGVTANIFPESKLVIALSKNVLNTLIITLICTILVWFAQYHWKRRRLYRMASQTKGPVTLPFIGNALYFLGSTSDIFTALFRLAKEFESPVRIWLGQKLFFLLWKPKDLEIIMNSPYALQKDELYKFIDSVTGAGLLNAPVPTWKRHRKVIMPTFNQKILDEFVEVFSEQSVILNEQLKKEVGKGTFDMFRYLGRCGLDIICESAMGIEVNAQTTDSNYFKWVNTAFEILFTRIMRVFYHYDFIFNRTTLAKDLNDAVMNMEKFTATVVTEKRKAYDEKLKEARERPEAYIEEETTKRKPFLQQLIELSEQGANFTDEELVDEVKTFLVAGSDSSSSAEGFTFIMLGMFPDAQKKVYEEVMDVIGPDRAVEPSDLGNLKFMERVIKETLRLFPVGPILSRRLTEDIKLEKCTIPAGSSVVMLIICTHRDPSIWPNPLKFDPDRFLPEEIANRYPYDWLPFSGGPRNCAGPRYAMMMMKTIIATVIRKYRFSTEYKSVGEIRLKPDLVMKASDGYKVSIELRE